MRRTSASRYVAVVEERYLSQMIAARFSILDTVRAIGEEQGTVTLPSVWAAAAKRCARAWIWPRRRGYGFGPRRRPGCRQNRRRLCFYGGVSRSVEKRSKVKSRIIASALKDLIAQCEDVFIMGHKRSDLDCVGAAAGHASLLQNVQKPASIVVNRRQSFAANLIREFEKQVLGTILSARNRQKIPLQNIRC